MKGCCKYLLRMLKVLTNYTYNIVSAQKIPAIVSTCWINLGLPFKVELQE